MQLTVAVAQVPVCWSVPRNLDTILAAVGGAGAGTARCTTEVQVAA